MQTWAPEKSQMFSLSLSTPLQGLFTKHSHLNVYDRLSIACDAHKQFVFCLNKCPESKSRQVLEAGQSSWSFICNSFEDSTDFQDEVLPCWQAHGELISTKCHIHAVMVHSSVMDVIQNGWSDPTSTLDDLCRSVTLYDKCYIGQSDVLCGQKGWKFLLQLNTRNSM
ncbi:unnamed protein product [Bursaphelenchus okinawaensis]|uniref:Uncharacterized protein n=1 Tax=Bursaphelenchus okinawaensis TaxID=465554 RepID=A0A811LDC9_9BILA|nr:unnamed protein product [Bursaphelenchus okinawaensis]CAG9123194.1 unnamed protein product [Bursaphelenchus okinawaensis]